MVDILITLAEILIIISLMFRDILYLRILTSAGLVIYIIAALWAGLDVVGMKALLILNMLALFINSYQIINLLLSRAPVFLPEKLKQIYKENFYMLTPTDFLKIYNISKPVTTKKDEILSVQGKDIDYLYLITSGSVTVEIDSKVVKQIGKHFYIGEMSLLTDSAATATVVANTAVELIAWDKKELRKLELDDLELYTKLYQSISHNLIRKIHH